MTWFGKSRLTRRASPWSYQHIGSGGRQNYDSYIAGMAIDDPSQNRVCTTTICYPGRDRGARFRRYSAARAVWSHPEADESRVSFTRIVDFCQRCSLFPRSLADGYKLSLT